MLSKLIRTILDENNPGTSSCMEDRLSLFEDKAEDKKMRIQANNFLSQASVYSADSNTLQKNRFYFLKPALRGMKQNFLADFEEYLLSRSIDTSPVKNLVSMFEHFIPDTFYPEWSVLGLEDRLVVFDLLLSLLIGSTLNSGDKLKIYFNELLKLANDFDICLYASTTLNPKDQSFKKIIREQKYKNILILVGPEAGIDESEISKLSEWTAITLGPRILRTEVAPLYIMSAIGYELELGE